MEYKFHIIDKEEKLSSIAAKYNCSPNEIKAHNPGLKTFGGFVGGEFVSVGQKVRIPIIELDESAEPKLEDNYINHLEFLQKARYRCEQINTSKMDGNLVHYVNQKFQYILRQNLEKHIGAVKLEDYFYHFEPSILNNTFDFIGKTEFIRNNVVFTLSEQGIIQNILNKNEIYQKWKSFKEKEFDKFEFIKRLKETNTVAVEDLKIKGDLQFSPEYNSEEEYRRNLFYLICFDNYLYMPVEEIKKKEFPFLSTIVPPLIIPLKFRYDKVSEENRIVTIRKVSTVDISKELEKEIEKKYDELYKSNIKFNYTEYKIDFRIKIEFNTQDKILETARLVIREQIADNVDNTCEFTVKRLENYTS